MADRKPVGQLTKFTDAAGREAYQDTTGRVYTEGGKKDTFYSVSDWNSRQTKKYGTPKNTQEVDSYLDSYRQDQLKTKSDAELLKEVETNVLPDVPKPTPPKLLETFEGLREDYGLSDLEAKIREYTGQEADIEAALRQRTQNEEGKPVAMNVIAGRVDETTRQERENLDFISRQKARVIDEVQGAYSIINTMLTLTEKDYTLAVDDYDRQFKNNLTIYNTFRDVKKDLSDELYRQQQVATANLQIFSNLVKGGNLDYSNLPADTRVNITKMEVQSGLGVGFISSIRRDNPEGEVKSITTRDEGGKKYADVIIQGADGKLKIETRYLGGSGDGGGAGTSSAFNTAIEKGIGDLKDGENWGTVWNRIKSQFPNTANETIDARLGTQWKEGGAYEAYKGKSASTGTATEVSKAKQLIQANGGSSDDVKRVETDASFRAWVLANYYQ